MFAHRNGRARIVSALLLVSATAAGSAACTSSRPKECGSLLDVDRRLARDVHTYPDAKAVHETAQNWADDAAKLQSERDALERLDYRDARLAQWASKWRDMLPIHARVARHLSEALLAADWAAAWALQHDWDDQQRKLDGVSQDVEAYCGR